MPGPNTNNGAQPRQRLSYSSSISVPLESNVTLSFAAQPISSPINWEDLSAPSPFLRNEFESKTSPQIEKKAWIQQATARLSIILNSPIAAWGSLTSYMLLNSWNAAAHIARSNVGATGPLIDSIGDIQTGIVVAVATEILRRVPGSISRRAGELSFIAVCSWITLGESLLPQIFPGTPQVADIPAGVIGATLGYVFSRRGIVQGFRRAFDGN